MDKKQPPEGTEKSQPILRKTWPKASLIDCPLDAKLIIKKQVMQQHHRIW